MGDSMHLNFPAALSRAQRKIEQWRQRHRPRARIPEELWREAAQLACAHGVNRTARALRLDYYALKKRPPRLDPASVPLSSWRSCPAGCPSRGPSA